MQQNLWQQTLSALELELDPAVISTWFNSTHLYETSEDKLIIACADSYSKNVIQSRYADKIKALVTKIQPTTSTIEYIVKPHRVTESIEGPLFDEAPTPSPESTSSSITQTTQSNYLTHNHLNQTYTLDNFVVGVSNRVVHAAAVSVIENPGSIYNPLFIYGPTGVGKTHLLHAIGNAFKQNTPDYQVLYTTTERFVTDLIEHIRHKKEMRKFREKYRSCDVLLIDDIQFIASKEASQEEFYHTFNELYQVGNQIVIASDRNPNQIEGLADRLVSRFQGGLMTMINAPDYETRLAIVTAKSIELGLHLSSSICEYIAEHSVDNVREVQGTLLQIQSAASSQNQIINLAFVRSLLEPSHHEKQPPRRITPELILNLVTEYFNTSIKEICGKKRNREIVIPRQLTMFLLRNELGMQLEAIGEIIGGRDHTTIMHGCDKIKAAIEVDNNLLLRSQLNAIRQELYA